MSVESAIASNPIVYTIFRDRTASKKYELAETWGEIVGRIKSPKVASEKSALPLISMGVYGDARTQKNALRHQANLREITGIEGDYDGETVPMEDAAERVALAGIRAVFYTSPSHTPEKPRWRILAPLTCASPPEVRARMVARINGILGGILTGESFTLSQSFYIGKVEGREYEVIQVDGDCIDTRDEFDQTAIMPAGKSTDDDGNRDETTDDELREKIRSGENFHEALRSLSARLIGRGMPAADAVAVLTGLMNESADKGSVRWQERFREIPRLVDSAASKFADPRKEADVPTPPDDDRFTPVDVLADAGPTTGDVQAPPAPSEGDDAITLIAFDLAKLLAPIEPETELLPGIPTEAYTLIAGGLASAKTTFMHSLGLARGTGYDFLHLGERPGETGPVVLFSYEDTDKRIFRRFQILVQYQHALILAGYGKKAAAEYMDCIGRNLRRVTLTGKAGTGIVCRDHSGNVAPNATLIEELVGKVRQFAQHDVLIGLDPLRLAIVGSQSDDDGADVVVHVLNDLASRLPNSGLVIPSHTTKAGAIEPGKSQASAAYSTSGSALYSQHARSNFLMARMAADEIRSTFGADEVTVEEAEQQRVVQLTHARLSHGPESRKRYYAMRGGVLVPVRPNAQELPLAERARRSLPAVDEAIAAITGRGMVVSRKALEEVIGIARTRKERRDYIGECISQGWLQEAGSTSDKRMELTPAGRAQLSPSVAGESDTTAA